MNHWLMDVLLSGLILLWSAWRLSILWRRRFDPINAHLARSFLFACAPLLMLLGYWVAKF